MSWKHTDDITLSNYDDPGSKFPAAVIRSDDPESPVSMVAFVTHDRLYPDETNRNIRLVENAGNLLSACEKLITAAERREYTMGDPCNLIEAKEALASAAREARELVAKVKHRFQNVTCSQCGAEFGPGEHGFSHCENHKHLTGRR